LVAILSWFLGARGDPKTFRMCCTVVKNDGFHDCGRVPRKCSIIKSNSTPKPPPQARNLPREKTESGVRNSSCCNGAPPCLLRLSGGPTVNLSRCPWSGGPTVNLLCFLRFRWSYGKSLAFSVVWWSYGKYLAFFRGLVVLR